MPTEGENHDKAEVIIGDNILPLSAHPQASVHLSNLPPHLTMEMPAK